MILALALSILPLVGQSTAAPVGSRWPVVPEPLFALNGTLSGPTKLKHVLIATKTEVPSDEKPTPASDPSNARVELPSSSSICKSMEVVFTSPSEGVVAKLGGFTAVAKGGHLWLMKDGDRHDAGPLHDGVNDLQFIKHYDSLLVYINGERSNQTIMPTGPMTPIQLGMEGWNGLIVATCGYSRVLSEDEIVANQRRGQQLAKTMFADTKTVTVEAELGAFTPVPSLDQIAPYRSALVADEYTITKVVEGRMSALKPGMKIRIFRWGLLAGNRTLVAGIKTGDKAVMTIQPLSSDPKFEKEFQVDNLDGDINALYFVDVTPQK